MSDKVVQLSVGDDGTVWAVDSAQRLWRFANNDWTQPDPNAKAIQVSVGNAKNIGCVNANGELYEWKDNKWQHAEKTTQNKGLSVASDGTAWYINKDNRLLKKEGNQWVQNKDGVAVQISVADAKNLWAVNGAGEVWHLENGAWHSHKAPVKARQVSGAADGVVWMAGQDGKLYILSGSEFKVDPANGRGIYVDAQNSKIAYAVNEMGQIWRYDSGKWIQVPAPKFPQSTTYTVKQGDHLMQIARNLGVDYQALLKANPQLKNPNLLKPGDVLHIPPQK